MKVGEPALDSRRLRRIERVIGMGDGFAGRGGDFALVTFALGSCVGLTLWDPLARVGGMLHSQLPVSSLDAQRASSEPFLFTDTAVTELLRRVYGLGGERSRITARIAGCSDNGETTFRVGKRNLAVARRVLWKNDILLKAEEVGEPRPRTMVLDMSTGVTTVRSNGAERPL